MVVNRKTRDAIKRIWHDGDAAREGAQQKSYVIDIIAKAAANFAFGVGMQDQVDAERHCGGLPCVIVGRVTDAAKAEDDFA